MGRAELPPYQALHLRTHVGGPDVIEVVEAPTQIAISLDYFLGGAPLHNGSILILGTPGLGCGRVAYQIYAWDPSPPALRAALLPRVPEDCEGPRG